MNHLKLRRGRKVKVWSANQKHYLGIWQFVRMDYIGLHDGKRKIYTPVFSQGKKIIHGYASWWIPLNEALKIEVKYKLNSRLGRDE